MVTAKKHTPRGLNQDRKLVAGEQPYEVRYVAQKAGVTPADAKKVIDKAGPSRKAIEKALAPVKKAVAKKKA